MAKKHHYETLGVPEDATEDQIKKAYRKKASALHPDKQGGNPEKMAEVNRAWECLGDPARRLTYDRSGHDDSQGPTVEEAGKGTLLATLDSLLNEGNADSLLLKARNALMTEATKLNQQQAQMGAAVRGLTKSRNKVRRKKAGQNLYHLLIDKRLYDLETAKTVALRRGEELKAALALLDDYEQDPEPETIFTQSRSYLFDEALKILDQGRPKR